MAGIPGRRSRRIKSFKKKKGIFTMKYFLIAAIISVMGIACSETGKQENVTGNEDTMVLQTADNLSNNKMERINWDQVSFTSPIVSYDEITSKEIEVRKDSNETSYFSLDEDVLFAFDKATLKPGAEKALQQVANAIKNRYPNGDIGIFGYTDSVGSKNYNKQLSDDRAEAVKQYLQQQTGIDVSRINTYAKGESNPVASNATEAGRQQNRRVEIVAMNNQ